MRPSEGHNSAERLQAPEDNSTLSCVVTTTLDSDAGCNSTESPDEIQRNANDGDGEQLLTTDVAAAGL